MVYSKYEISENRGKKKGGVRFIDLNRLEEDLVIGSLFGFLY